MLTADFCREHFSLYSGSILKSVIIKIDSRLVFYRESFLIAYIRLSPFPDAFYKLCELFVFGSDITYELILKIQSTIFITFYPLGKT